MAECSVQVGIRIRPFNEREKALGAKLCVDMDGPKTILLPVEASEEPRTFSFDASFWSHDGFEIDEKGYSKASPGSRYADQQQVFEKLGTGVLDNAWEGYHCCLFAYGQTGSGKSYSMVGYGANRGIVPVSCEDIFNRISKNTVAGLTFEVSVSMIEIYNECVQDLLVRSKDRPRQGLQLRENRQLGIYVDGVRKRPVNSYAAIESVTEEGTSNRTVGATLMNATSSRAHTVITIEFKQVLSEDSRNTEKLSMINLVDLAGSEKADQSGATGDRLKEGCAINKSLSALGNVIEKLADKATGKAKAGAVIPYRDSKLTRLLQNALGGSSKTVMICAISPASSNHEETLGTLRYADRAKRIKNTAVINENPQEKMIRELKEENEKLKKAMGGDMPNKMSAEEVAQKESEIAALQEALKNMEKSFAERVADSEQEMKQEGSAKKDANLKGPHIANLNEDQMLMNKLHFAFKEGPNRFGKDPSSLPLHQRPDTPPDIVLGGSGIYKEQATLWLKNGKCTLESNGLAQATTKVNGKMPEGDGVLLIHGDRVAFGNTMFMFVDPSVGDGAELLSSGKVTYAMAMKEFGGKHGASEEELAETRKQSAELERKAKEAEEAKKKALDEAEAKLKQREDEFQVKLEAMKQQDAKNKEAEIERLQKEFEEKNQQAAEEAQRLMKELEKYSHKAAADEEKNRKKVEQKELLDEKLAHVMPLVNEANIIGKELGMPQQFETKMQLGLGDEQGQLVGVTVAVLQEGVQLYEWTPPTLENRVYLMRELLQRFDDEGPSVLESLTDEVDPFWDPVVVERQIGVAQVLLEGLLDQLENVTEVKVMNSEGSQAGTLKVEIWPVGSNGEPGIPDEEIVEDLLGTKMVLLLKVISATNLPEELANNVRVEYQHFFDRYQVPSVAGRSCNPEFNYEKTFVQDPVTTRFKEYLTGCLQLHVYGENSKAAEVAAAPAVRSGLPSKPAIPRSAENAPVRGHHQSASKAAAGDEADSSGATGGRVKDIERVRDTRAEVRAEISRLWELAGLPLNGDGTNQEAVADLCLATVNQAEGERGEPLRDSEIAGLVMRVLCLAASLQAAAQS